MNDLAVAVFWVGFATAVYSYVGFPLVARLLASVRPARGGPPDVNLPIARVTMIIPAYNEDRHLEAKIRNALSTDYPTELLELIVVSDASTDRTNEVAAGFAPDGVQLIVQDTRRGKTAGLNRAMAVATGDIVVFTDANAMFPRESIRRLVSYFGDAAVGLVTGYTRYTGTPGGDTEEATNAYTSLERVIKRAESRWGCCMGADGAIFAMRKELYRTLRDDDINDLVLPLAVIDQGYRCLLAEDVFCFESSGESLQSEFRRQSRIANRSLRAIRRYAHLLNPFRFPTFAYFLFSHKVVRFTVPVLLAPSAIALVFLATNGGLYSWFAAGALAIGLIISLSYLTRRLRSSQGEPVRLIRLANVLLIANLAILHGWWRFVSGHAETTWQHERVAARK